MFGMGMGELLVIAVVALLFLGPEKLPEAAKTLSKGIRDLRKQTRELTQSIEDDEEIGGAIRDIKSALRGDEVRGRKPPPKKPAADPAKQPPPADAEAAESATAADPAEQPEGEGADTSEHPESEDDDAIIKPVADAVAKGSLEPTPSTDDVAPEPPEPNTDVQPDEPEPAPAAESTTGKAHG
jgi:sec-independent protein translocase protein TatB